MNSTHQTLKKALAFACLFVGVTGCTSWQGTYADRGGTQNYGSPADWNKGTGSPGSAGVPAPEQSPSH